ncbi:RNA polymerase sigma-70 factor [Niastella caeni]|uniref:RNA polymerase sigma-70 factor n=1 Tax=Niastella caeni TaxID=2569763 RepID=UPI0014094243|nr:RNA polymerase sigma-70 factor [Niastella caeni]
MDLHDGIINNDNRLTAVVERYFQSCFEGLYRYAFTLLKNNDDAKDAVQAVFVKLWEKRASIDEQQSMQSYLYTSVFHYCLNVKRHEKVRTAYIQNHQSIPHVFNDALTSRENVALITEALESLPPQCKLIFLKSRFEKKKYAEIAEELNLSVKTVEAQIGKALKILREKLSEVLILLVLLLTQ